MSKICAVGDYLTVSPLKEQNETTKSGLIAPKSQSKIVAKGIVESIGTGRKIKSMDLKIGDIVYYQDIERDLWFSKDHPDGLYFIRQDMLFGKQEN